MEKKGTDKAETLLDSLNHAAAMESIDNADAAQAALAALPVAKTERTASALARELILSLVSFEYGACDVDVLCALSAVLQSATRLITLTVEQKRKRERERESSK
jgi:hypothetical protein